MPPQGLLSLCWQCSGAMDWAGVAHAEVGLVRDDLVEENWLEVAAMEGLDCLKAPDAGLIPHLH